MMRHSMGSIIPLSQPFRIAPLASSAASHGILRRESLVLDNRAAVGDSRAAQCPRFGIVCERGAVLKANGFQVRAAGEEIVLDCRYRPGNRDACGRHPRHSQERRHRNAMKSLWNDEVEAVRRLVGASPANLDARQSEGDAA